MIIISAESSQKMAKNIAFLSNSEYFCVKTKDFSRGEFLCDKFEFEIGADVVIIFSNYFDVNKAMIELIFMAKMAMSQNPRRIRVVMPYIPYSRQDKGAVRWIGEILQFIGIEMVITLDIHSNTAIDSLGVHVVNISLFDVYKKSDIFIMPDVVVAPDIGATDRAALFAENLGCALIVIDKRGEFYTDLSVVTNRNCLVVDDIIDSGKTMLMTIEKLQKQKACINIIVSHASCADLSSVIDGRLYYACGTDDRYIRGICLKSGFEKAIASVL